MFKKISLDSSDFNYIFPFYFCTFAPDSLRAARISIYLISCRRTCEESSNQDWRHETQARPVVAYSDDSKRISDMSASPEVPAGHPGTLVPSEGLTPFAIPEAESSTSGVSVRYAPSPNSHWFVFRARYGKELPAANYIIERHGVYAYVPRQYCWIERNGESKRILKSIIPNLLFVYTDHPTAELLAKKTPELPFITYLYDHTRRNEDGFEPCIIVPDGEMQRFIRICSSHDEHLLWLTGEDFSFEYDDPVVVTEGRFKGEEGFYVRAAGQRRLVIRLSKIGYLATAYIPAAFIKPQALRPPVRV